MRAHNRHSSPSRPLCKRTPPGRAVPSLVGRDDDLRRVVDVVASVRRGRGRLVIIEGEAGSGKTTLLAHIAGLATGFTVYRADAHEIDRDRPFGPILEALRVSGDARDAQRRAIAEDLRAVSATRGDDLRYRVLEDIVALIERDALEQPALLALDDMHWVDDPSVLVLHHLARRAEHLPILIVLALRPGHGQRGFELLDDTVLGRDAERLRLGPLETAEVDLLAQRLLGTPPGEGLRGLLARAGGNPFFVTELLAALREDHSIDIGEVGADIPVTESRPELRMVILHRLGGLPPATIRTLRVAAIIGAPFTAVQLSVALGTALADVANSLEHAIAAGVLRPDGDRLAFRHDLIREALYGDVPRPIRAALHLDIARALRRSGAPPTECAPHFMLGARPGDQNAIESLRAAAADVSPTDPRAAARWLARALELVPVSDERHDDIVAETCTVQLRFGDASAAEELARVALSRPQPRDRRVELTRLLAQALDEQELCVQAADVYDAESRAQDLDEGQSVRLAAYGVEKRAHVGAVSLEVAGDVLRRAESVGDAESIRWVLAALLHLAHWRGDFTEGVQLAERTLEQALKSDRFAHSGGLVGECLIGAGRLREAEESLRAELRTAEARRELYPTTHILYQLASLEFQSGRWDEATSDAEAAAGLATDFRQDSRYDEAATILASIALRRDEVDRAARLVASMRGTRWFIGAPARAMLAEATGDRHRALTLMRDAWDLARSTGRRSALPSHAPALVRLELEVGERDRAGAVTEALEEYAADAGIAWLKVAALRCRGRIDEAAAPLLEAVNLARDAEMPDHLAAALEDAGLILARAGRREEAIALLEDALAYARRVGAARDERRLESRLRDEGVRHGRRGRRPREAGGWVSLTGTERRVADLAVTGLTNSEIGRRLFISGRTVERHLTHIYAKLGIGSRVELATLAAGHLDRH